MKFTRIDMTKGDNGGSYLKVPPGESVKGVFRGEPFSFFQAWPQGGQKQIFDKPTAGASARFKINFVVHENGKFVAKVFEFGAVVNNQLVDLSEDYDIETTKVRISRQGEGKNTVYTIIPVAKEKLTPGVLAEIEAVQLLALATPPAQALAGKFESEIEPAKPVVKNHAPGADDDSAGLPF